MTSLSFGVTVNSPSDEQMVEAIVQPHQISIVCCIFAAGGAMGARHSSKMKSIKQAKLE